MYLNFAYLSSVLGGVIEISVLTKLGTYIFSYSVAVVIAW